METVTASNNHLWASFPTYESASEAIAALLDHGVAKEDLHLIAKEIPPEYDTDHKADAEHHAESGITTTTALDAGIGASKGVSYGLGVGILAGLAAIAVPGFGLVIGGGALTAALLGTAGATVAGGLAGAVTGYLKDQGADERASVHITKQLEAGAIILDIDTVPSNLTRLDFETLVAKYGGSEMSVKRKSTTKLVERKI